MPRPAHRRSPPRVDAAHSRRREAGDDLRRDDGRDRRRPAERHDPVTRRAEGERRGEAGPVAAPAGPPFAAPAAPPFAGPAARRGDRPQGPEADPVDLFIVTPPGIESLTLAELHALAPALAPTVVTGGLEVRGAPALVHLFNHRLRTATRVLLRVASFRAASFAELHQRAGRIPWERYLRPGEPVTIRASAHRSRLYHTGGIAERVLKGIGDRLGVAPPHVTPPRDTNDDEAPSRATDDPDAAAARDAPAAPANPDTPAAAPPATPPAAPPAPALILARIVDDRCTLSLDTSGEPLHFRGYRLATAKAPLRPTLAAALLLAAGWRGDEALVDPMCGSGTLVLEAALLAAGHPPGAARTFAAERWPAPPPAAPAPPLPRASAPLILGSDRDPGAIRAATANAARAGVTDRITLRVADLAELTPPAPTGLVLTNPPYGVRVGEGRQGARRVYQALGRVLRERFAGPGRTWRLALLAPDPGLAAATGLDLAPILRFDNGGLPVALYAGPVG